MTQPAEDAAKALAGLDAARRAGWAKAYQQGRALLLLEGAADWIVYEETADDGDRLGLLALMVQTFAYEAERLHGFTGAEECRQAGQAWAAEALPRYLADMKAALSDDPP